MRITRDNTSQLCEPQYFTHCDATAAYAIRHTCQDVNPPVTHHSLLVETGGRVQRHREIILTYLGSSLQGASLRAGMQREDSKVAGLAKQKEIDTIKL